MHPAPIYLIACSATKRTGVTKARDLYCGALFRSSRRLVEALAAPWAILSAKHGLLQPDDLVETYDQTIGHRKDERAAWATRVAQQLVAAYLPGTRFIILAAAAYRLPFEHCGRDLAGRFTWEAPLAGMGIGCQKQWLARAAAAVAA